MAEPTKEQIERFWERCGIRYEVDQDVFKVIFPDGEWYNFGANWEMGEIEPPIDLNNLFLSAVPKALKVIAEKGYCPPIMKLFQLWYDELVTQAGDSSNVERAALALFWVLWEVLNVKAIKS